MKPWKAELLLVLVTLIWGATFTFTKLGLESSSVFIFLFIRFSIALSISLLLWGKYFFRTDRNTLKSGFILGLLFSGGFILQTAGLNLTSVTKSAFITGMAVVLTPLAYKLIIRKKIRIFQTIGIVIAAGGLWIFTNPSWDNINFGDMLTLLSAFFWAFYITYMDVFTKNITKFENTIQLVMMQFAIAIPISLIGYLIFESGEFKLQLTNNLLVAFIYNGIIASIFLTLIHTSVQKYSNPVKAALIFSLEPIFASVIAMFTLNEGFTTLEAIGALILFSGVLFSETAEYLFKFFVPKEIKG